jgi:alpha-L-glutamate ligase-like protein/uncharacterized protein (TIGR02421 family)
LPDQFVLKPNSGAGGEGILPVWGRKDGHYVLSNGNRMSPDEFNEHITDILSGRFSISGIADTAFFEQLLICDERLAKYCYKGLPDLRIVVYNLIPVMAMLRLPTKKSNGKANLHQGAIGVGIDIAKGEATHIAQGHRIIEEIPDVGPIRGLKIPYWDDILMAASRVQLETNLGYMAVDISIDQSTGPVLLEINARAGLGVQIANLAPLQRRLERIQGIKVSTPEKGVRVAKDMFGNVVEKEIKHMTGREIVGSLEPVKVLVGANPYRLMAKVNAGQEKSLLSRDFAAKVGLVEEDSDVKTQKLKFIMAGKRVQTVVDLVDLDSKEELVVGRRDLTGFLLDPSKAYNEEGKGGMKALPTDVEKVEEDPSVQRRRRHYKTVDDVICEVDQQIKLLYHIRPVNLASERERFLKGEVDNPQFIYPELKFDPYQLREQLMDLSLDDSPLGRLFDRKRQEILGKIDLLIHRGTSSFTNCSIALFGQPTADLVQAAEEGLASKDPDLKSPRPSIHAPEALKRFDKFFRRNELSQWKVKLRKNMVADCVAGKRNTFFVREDVAFTATRYKMVVAHEIETHIYTAENGKRQPYKIFQRGTGNYLTTQEGLAIYNQEQAVDVMTAKHYWNMALVLVIAKAQESSFRDVFDYAKSLGYEDDRAFQFALKSKRGLEDTSKPGGFTKDLIYFRGKRIIEDYVASGGDLKRLYIGKIDLPSLAEIEEMDFLVSPKHLPETYSTKE